MKLPFLLAEVGKGGVKWQFYAQTEVHHPHGSPNNMGFSI